MTAPPANPIDLFRDEAPTTDEMSAWWDVYGYLVQTLLGGTILVLLLVTLAYTKLRKRPLDGWVASTVTFLVLIYQSHGMWGLIDRELHLPLAMKIGGFFIMEALVLFFGAKAKKRFLKTIVYDENEPERIIANGRPGWPGALVWVIAISSGTLVGLSEDGWIAFFFRFFIGLIAASMWWANLTEDRIALDVKRKRPRTRWRLTPKRLMVEWGWLEADEDDVDDTNDQWLERKLTKLAFAHHFSAVPLRKAWNGKRLRTWSMRATDEILDGVRDNLLRISTVKDRTNPENALGDRLTEQAARHEAAVRQLAEQAEAERAALVAKHQTELAEVLERQEASDGALEALRAELTEQMAAALDEREREFQGRLAEFEAERERLLEQLNQTREAAAEQLGELTAEVTRLRPLAEAGAASRKNNSATERANGSAASGSAERVPTQPVPTPREPVAAPSAHATAGTAALAPQPLPEAPVVPEAAPPTGDARAALHAAWNEMVESRAITGEESTTVLAERGTEHLSIEVKLRTAQKYASEWKKDPFRSRPPAPQPEPSDPRRGLYSVPNQ